MTFCEMPSIILTSDRVADACGACNLGRACGVSSFFLMRKRGESCMAKVFFSYQQQIEKLVKEYWKILENNTLRADLKTVKYLMNHDLQGILLKNIS